MAFTRTNERVFNRMALIMAPQTASGAPVSDFSSGTGAMVWARNVLANENPQFESNQGSQGSIFEVTDGFIHTHQLPEIEVRFYPTPTLIKEMLKSFAGPFVGSAVTFTPGIDKFFSFLFAEAEDGVVGQNAYRYADAWVRELEISVGGFGVAEATARIIGQIRPVKLDTDAAGLIYPQFPNDFQQMAHRAAELIKDPASENLKLAMSQFTINMKHGFRHEPFNGDIGLIVKQGFMEVTGTLISRLMDETSGLRDDALAETLRKFRLSLFGGGSELRLDLNNVFWDPTNLGFADRNALDFNQTFRVGSSDVSTEDPVEIIVTP